MAMIATLASCTPKHDEHPNTQYFDAIATFRPLDNGDYYIKIDDRNAIIPINDELQEYPFSDGKEKRALIEYSVNYDDQSGRKIDGYIYTQDARIYYADTIRCKNPVSANSEEMAKAYGTDPVTICVDEEDWPNTIVEDGYLNVRFSLPGSYLGIQHEVNLVYGMNPDDPYEVWFMHNANGDSLLVPTDNLICFPLKDLPDTFGATEPLTLVWFDYLSGETERATFDYCTRTDW